MPETSSPDMSAMQYPDRQRGFTLIELLIIVAILALVAGTIIPNMITFFGTGNLAAARAEIENVKTAALGYYGEYRVWPSDSSVLTGFVERAPRATYVFDTGSGSVIGVSDVTWSGISWSTEDGTWTRS